MKAIKLTFVNETDMFGTRIWAQSADNSYRELSADYMETNPLNKMDTKVKKGYLFRNPKTDISDLSSVFETLSVFENKFNIWAEKNDKDIVTYVRVADVSDATMFAFAQVETFQKWSDQLDKEARKEARRKPQKVKINKDGTVTVRVTATTLSDHQD